MSPSTSRNERDVMRHVSALPAPLKASGFWSAILLPFLSLGLLASGLDSSTDYVLLAAFLVANVIALLIGHDYGQ